MLGAAGGRSIPPVADGAIEQAPLVVVSSKRIP